MRFMRLVGWKGVDRLILPRLKNLSSCSNSFQENESEKKLTGGKSLTYKSCLVLSYERERLNISQQTHLSPHEQLVHEGKNTLLAKVAEHFYALLLSPS
jgi:hypothetical protein